MSEVAPHQSQAPVNTVTAHRKPEAQRSHFEVDEPEREKPHWSTATIQVSLPVLPPDDPLAGSPRRLGSRVGSMDAALPEKSAPRPRGVPSAMTLASVQRSAPRGWSSAGSWRPGRRVRALSHVTSPGVQRRPDFAQIASQRRAAERPVGQSASPQHAGRPAVRVRFHAPEVGAARLSTIQRKGEGEPVITPDVESRVAGLKGGGNSLPDTERRFFERRMGADFSQVRIHTGSKATRTARDLDARAYTMGSDIVFNKGQYQPGTHAGRGLLAHELTHVMQQAPPGARWKGAFRQPSDVTATGQQIQRLPSAIAYGLDSFARHIPGYTLFTQVAGFNPLTGDRVVRSGAGLLEGMMGLVPFGTLVADALRRHGILGEAGAWIEGQLGRLNLSVGRMEQAFEKAWDEVSLFSNSLQTNIDIVKRHFNALYNDVVSFAKGLVQHLIGLVEKAAVDQADRLLADNKAWALIKKILRRDPLRGTEVEATTAEILADFLILIGKQTELEQMRKRGTLQRTADWLDARMDQFKPLLGQLKGLFLSAWNAIQPSNLPELPQNLRNLVTQTGTFLQGVWDFAKTVAKQVLTFVKRSLLAWLSSFAHEVPGFHLVTVILGKNPFTGKAVERTPRNIIKGFITLMPGGEAQLQQLEQTGTIDQAAQRIEGAMQSLGISWESITGLFRGLWNSLSIDDLLEPVAAFQRVVDRFGQPIKRLFEFIQVVVKEIFLLVLALMNFPTDIINRIIANAMTAFEDIKRDPVGFFKNMLGALKLGFSNFFSNIAEHLLNGVTDWLFKQLEKAGIQRPADLSFQSILTMVLQVLNISAERIWQKLAEKIGEDKVRRMRGAIDKLTGIWTFIRDVQERGVAAIWERIQAQLSNLWDLVLTTARNWIVTQVIEQVTAKLLSMLDPTGIMAVVNSFIAVFKAIQSAIEYIREMLLIVDDYVSTVADIAAGKLDSGAKKLESGLARSVPVAIGFLANQVGLGNLGQKIAEIIGGIRERVDQAIDWLLEKAVAAGGAFLRGVKSAAQKVLGFFGIKKTFQDGEGKSHSVYYEDRGGKPVLMVASTPQAARDFLAFYVGKNKMDDSKHPKYGVVKEIEGTLGTVEKKNVELEKANDDSVKKTIQQQLLGHSETLSKQFRKLLGKDEETGEVLEKYLLEGMAATYATMPRLTGDDLTPDHQPQAAIFEWAAEQPYFGKNSEMAKHAASDARRGVAINLYHKRHVAGRTYGRKGGGTKKRFVEKAKLVSRTRRKTGKKQKYTAQEKRDFVVQLMKRELRHDVAAMRLVISRPDGDPIWDDLRAAVKKAGQDEQKEGKQWIAKVRQNISRGEDQVANQDLDKLKKP